MGVNHAPMLEPDGISRTGSVVSNAVLAPGVLEHTAGLGDNPASKIAPPVHAPDVSGLHGQSDEEKSSPLGGEGEDMGHFSCNVIK